MSRFRVEFAGTIEVQWLTMEFPPPLDNRDYGRDHRLVQGEGFVGFAVRCRCGDEEDELP